MIERLLAELRKTEEGKFIPGPSLGSPLLPQEKKNVENRSFINVSSFRSITSSKHRLYM